jgi:hypothetical protein
MQFDPIALLQAVPAIGPALPYAALAVAVASAAMPWLPRPSSTASAYGIGYALLNVLAQNFRNAAPVQAPASAPAPATPAATH